MEKEPEIKIHTSILMIFTAVLLDTLQAVIGWIPLIGNIFAAIISFFVFMTFWFWFHTYGLDMMTTKRFGSLGLGGLIEMIPYINILPGWTVVVIFIIGTTKLKEVTEKTPVLSKGARLISNKIKA